MRIGHSGVTERCTEQLTYLERAAPSSAVTVFLHGLGLDAGDYRDYLETDEKQHGIALTLKGFDPGEVHSGQPIPITDHVKIVSGFLDDIAAEHPGKKLVLVGFSLGADLILRLAEHWAGNASSAPPIEATLLLDPNVNQSTMTISRLFAEADRENPLPAFKELIHLAPDRDTLRTLCIYLAKVANKDFTQLWQLSRDMMSYWRPDGYSQIGKRLATVAEVSRTVRVALSAPYEEHLPAMQDAVLQHKAPKISFDLTKHGHFDLIRADILDRELGFIR